MCVSNIISLHRTFTRGIKCSAQRKCSADLCSLLLRNLWGGEHSSRRVKKGRKYTPPCINSFHFNASSENAKFYFLRHMKLQTKEVTQKLLPKLSVVCSSGSCTTINCREFQPVRLRTWNPLKDCKCKYLFHNVW